MIEFEADQKSRSFLLHQNLCHERRLEHLDRLDEELYPDGMTEMAINMSYRYEVKSTCAINFCVQFVFV